MPPAIEYDQIPMFQASTIHFPMFFKVRALHDGYVCQACQVEFSAAKHVTQGSRATKLKWDKSYHVLESPNLTTT